jgi:hypothetical protein
MEVVIKVTHEQKKRRYHQAPKTSSALDSVSPHPYTLLGFCSMCIHCIDGVIGSGPHSGRIAAERLGNLGRLGPEAVDLPSLSWHVVLHHWMETAVR